MRTAATGWVSIPEKQPFSQRKKVCEGRRYRRERRLEVERDQVFMGADMAGLGGRLSLWSAETENLEANLLFPTKPQFPHWSDG